MLCETARGHVLMALRGQIVFTKNGQAKSSVTDVPEGAISGLAKVTACYALNFSMGSVQKGWMPFGLWDQIHWQPSSLQCTPP
eukprot:3585424-Amphidinium_carterae.1